MADIEWDDSEFQQVASEVGMRAQTNAKKIVNDIATEILRLSGKEVPIHTVSGEPGGDLQNSGMIDDGEDAYEKIVGYNKVYAAYQHEGHWKDGSHQVTHYTNPRSKPKYLEDPIRENLEVFASYYMAIMEK